MRLCELIDLSNVESSIKPWVQDVYLSRLKRKSYGAFRTTVCSRKKLQSESSSTVLAGPGSDLLDKYVGGSEKNLKLIFEIAEKMAPTILLIDKIDGLMVDKSKQGSLINMVNVYWISLQPCQKKRYI